MERERSYRSPDRRGSSPQRGQYPRRSPQRGSSPYRRRKSGPPPFFIMALVLIVVIVAVVLIVVFARGNKDPNDSSASTSSNSQTSSLSSASAVSALTGSSAVSVPETVSATPPPEKVPTGTAQKLDSFFQIGGTGYEYYNFVEEYANQYITTISNVGKDLQGVTVYDMVIPTSMDIMLPESYIEENGINSSDQRKAIEEYIYPSITGLCPEVKTVPLFDALKLHNNEYVYFRTDHHWTNLGAYYAYVEFCKAKGVEPVALDQFDKKEYPGFLGSFYRDYPNSDMENSPDTVEAYVPKADTSMSYTTAEGETYEQPVIADGEGYDSEWLYLIFCAGDQPYEVITNSGLTDGSSCVVVKESFGNAFIPYLVNHYQTIYTVDYRYYQGNIADLVREKGAKDLIFVNNISMTRNEELVNSLDNSF